MLTRTQLAPRLPGYLTSFVGRQQELGELLALLQSGTRLLTLRGPGGSGKTRLAVELVYQVAEWFEDGVGWVNLDGVSEAALVPDEVLSALGFREAAVDTPALDLLVGALSTQQMLIVLDNCEHLLGTCANLADSLLKNAPDLVLLTTSRERLNLPGEQVWTVNGLSLSISATDGTPQGSFSEAARLFAERARTLLPSFSITSENREAVAEICQRLDGLPLAIELAAACIQILGVEQIASYLNHQIDLLGQTRQGQPNRHQTLRATITWSHDLLSAEERMLFRRLSVFRGPFSIDAVEALWLAGLPESPTKDKISTLDLLGSLVERSLVQVEHSETGQAHYRLLETLRKFGAEKLLEAGEADLIADAHLHYYQGLAREASTGLRGPDQPRWIARLTAERDNLNAALQHAMSQSEEVADPDRVRVALAMTGDLFWFWNAATLIVEGRDWLERALALSPQPHSSAERGQALWAAAVMAWSMGDFEHTRLRLDQSETLWQQLQDPQGLGSTWMFRGRLALYQSQPDQAIPQFRQAEAIFRKLDLGHELGQVLTGLSAALAMRGEYDQAYLNAQEGLELFEASGDSFFIALALGDLGWVEYHRGDIPAAARHLEEALALRRRIGAHWLTVQSLNHLAEVSRYQQHPEMAQSLLEESLVIAEEIRAQAWIAHGRLGLGLLAQEAERPTDAIPLLLRALTAYHEMQEFAGLARCLEALAAQAADEERWELAGSLFGGAANLREKVGPPRTPMEQVDYACTQEHLTSHVDRMALSLEAGRHMAQDELLRQARLVALRQVAPTIHVEARAARHALKIYGLGPAELYREGRRITPADWGYARPRELFFYLIENPPRSKEEIGLAFWPDASPEQLRRNLRSALYHLRQALGGRGWIRYENGRYAFNRAMD